MERLREMTAEPFARGDNGIELTKRISQRAQLAYDLIVLLVPRLLEKYKDQLVKFETKVDNTADITLGDDIVLIRLKAQSFGSMEEEKRRLTLLGSRSRTETSSKHSNKLRSILSGWIVTSDGRGRDRSVQSALS